MYTHYDNVFYTDLKLNKKINQIHNILGFLNLANQDFELSHSSLIFFSYT